MIFFGKNKIFKNFTIYFLPFFEIYTYITTKLNFIYKKQHSVRDSIFFIKSFGKY